MSLKAEDPRLYAMMAMRKALKEMMMQNVT